MTNDLRNEDRNALEEKTVFASSLQEHSTAFGIGFILVGALMLYNRIYHSLYRMDLIPQWVYRLLQDVPGVVVAFGVIVLGVWLVRGKKMTADRVKDYPRCKEGDREKEERDHDKRSA